MGAGGIPSSAVRLFGGVIHGRRALHPVDHLPEFNSAFVSFCRPRRRWEFGNASRSSLIWRGIFFDMGTSIAFVKYMSQHRVDDPKRGIQFGQVFVWWQFLSGAVQVALVVALAATVAPRSAYALYAWSVIIHAFIQIPGFYRVFLYAFAGFQRNDYARYLDIGLNVLLPMIVQPIFVGSRLRVGKSESRVRRRNGRTARTRDRGLRGGTADVPSWTLAVSPYRAQRAHSVFGALRLGRGEKEFPLRRVRNARLGGVVGGTGRGDLDHAGAADQLRRNLGQLGAGAKFCVRLQRGQHLTDGTMASISEAISHGRKILSQYYAVMVYKWGGMVSAFLGAVLLAVGPRFILGASGPDFARAATYAVPLLIWGAVQYPSWVGDQVQLGSNKPYLKSALVTGEQIIRVILALVLLQRFQVNALIIAYFVGLLTKDFVAYFVNDKLCFPQRFFFWQSVGAPLLAAGVHYLIMNAISAFIWQGDQLTSIAIFFIGVLPSLPVYMFLYGLFGGWDDATLSEFREAAAMTGPVRGMVEWMMVKPTALGARLSPLNNRFPI